MRIASTLCALAAGCAMVGCGGQKKDVPYSGPPIAPLTGPNVPTGYGPPGGTPTGRPMPAPTTVP